ncbi:MAG: Sigma-70, region 4 [Bacteroidota bacterium]|jgi:RNA polymerase sigma factor (sigma-70 family)
MNQKEITELYERLAAKYVRILQAASKSVAAADAEDAFHDAFTALMQEIENEKEIENIDAYFSRIAKNKLYDILRKRNRENPTDPKANSENDMQDMDDYVDYAEGEKLPMFQTPLALPDEVLQAKMLKEMVGKAMKVLKKTFQDVIELSFNDVEDLSDTEIASALGISVGTMRVRRSEAMMTLRKELVTLGFGFFKDVHHGNRLERRFFKL